MIFEPLSFTPSNRAPIIKAAKYSAAMPSLLKHVHLSPLKFQHSSRNYISISSNKNNSITTSNAPSSLILKDQSTQTGKTLLDYFHNHSNRLTHSLSDSIKPIQGQNKRIVLPDIRRCGSKMQCSYLFESKTVDNENDSNVGALKIIGRGIRKEGDKYVFRNKALRPLGKVRAGLRLNLGVLSPVQKGRIKKFIVNFNRFASCDE